MNQQHKRRTCTFPECTRPRHSLGLCHGHYMQWHGTRTLTPLRSVARGVPHEAIVAEVEELLPITAERIAEGLGIKVASLYRALRRAGRDDLWQRLGREYLPKKAA